MYQQLLHVITHVEGGTVTYPIGGQLGLRMQNNLQFVLMHSGHAYFHIDDERYLVPAGYVALLCPGHREQFRFSETTETRHRWVHIRLSGMDQAMLTDLESLPKYIPLSTHMNHLTDIIHELTTNYSEDTGNEVTASLALSMVTLYRSESKYHLQKSTYHDAVLKALEVIQQQFDQSLDLTYLAAISHVSPEYLIRLFREQVGVTPIRYLWKFRVDRVVEYLVHTGLSLKEISAKTGFQNTFHLSRMITQETGLPPSEIRKRNTIT